MCQVYVCDVQTGQSVMVDVATGQGGKSGEQVSEIILCIVHLY